jgi:hypothetical protein
MDEESLFENVQLLKSMGFIDEDDIKQALNISNNDINEAVSILTNEKIPDKITSLPTPNYPNITSSSFNNNSFLNNNDIDMSLDTSSSATTPKKENKFEVKNF